MTSGIIYQVKCHVKSDKMRHTHRKKNIKRAIPFYENKWTKIIIQRTNKDRTLIKFNAEYVRPNICFVYECGGDNRMSSEPSEGCLDINLISHVTCVTEGKISFIVSTQT